MQVQLSWSHVMQISHLQMQQNFMPHSNMHSSRHVYQGSLGKTYFLLLLHAFVWADALAVSSAAHLKYGQGLTLLIVKHTDLAIPSSSGKYAMILPDADVCNALLLHLQCCGCA